MKRIITLLLLLVAKSVFSQPVRFGVRSLNLSYVSLPSKPILDKNNRTFTIKVDSDNANDFKDAKGNLEYNFGLDGFKRVNANGYFEIVVHLINPIATTPNVQKIEKNVVGSGGITITEIAYKATQGGREFGSFDLICPADPSYNRTYSLKRDYTIEGIFSDFHMASSVGYIPKEDLLENYMQNIISTLDTRLNREFGYVIKQASEYLYVLGSDKHPEYDGIMTAYSKVKAVFNKMRYDEDFLPLKTELEPAIKYYEGIDKVYAADERKQKKLRYLAYYNLATIYYYLDMPEESNMWCDKIGTNDFQESDAESLKFRNESLKELLAANQVKSRHMEVEARTNGVEELIINKTADFDPNYFLKDDPAYRLISLVLNSKDTVSGYAKKIEIDNLDKKIAVSVPDEDGNHNFIFRTYYADQVSKLMLQENDFYSTCSFKVASKSSMIKPAFRFVRELLNGKTVTLYQYCTGEIILKKQSDPLGYSTNSVGWQMNTRTKFIELAASCPVLASRANKNEFNTSLESLWKFVEALDVCK